MTVGETRLPIAVIWVRIGRSLLVRHRRTLQNSVLQKEAKILIA